MRDLICFSEAKVPEGAGSMTHRNVSSLYGVITRMTTTSVFVAIKIRVSQNVIIGLGFFEL
jgi:hypothetical protein